MEKCRGIGNTGNARKNDKGHLHDFRVFHDWLLYGNFLEGQFNYLPRELANQFRSIILRLYMGFYYPKQ